MSLSNEHIGSKILAKIKLYILTRAELLFTLCYEIPCNQGPIFSQCSLKFESWTDSRPHTTTRNRNVCAMTLEKLWLFYDRMYRGTLLARFPLAHIFLFYPNLTIICQKVEKGLSHMHLKLVPNLTGWKTEYLIAQLRTGFRQKVFRLKTCPQGVLQAQ